MRIVLISVLTLIVGNTSLGQGCCSGGGGSPMAGGAATGVLQEGQVQILSSLKYSKSGTFYAEDRDTTPFFDYLSSNYLFLKADYGLTEKLTLSVATGYYFHRTIFEFQDTTYASDGSMDINQHEVSSKGFGDLIIFPRYSVYANTKKSIHSELSLGLGVKIPLGSHLDSSFVGYAKFVNPGGGTPFLDSNEIWTISPPTVQTTTGSSDMMFYAFYLKDFQKKNFKIFASALYIHKGWNSLGLKFGDYATVGISAATNVLKGRLNLLGQIKGEWVGKMGVHDDLDILSLYNIDRTSTGSRMLSFVPQVTYSFKKPSISLFATADIPLYQYMSGIQISSQLQVTAGVSYRFFAKKPVEKMPETIEDGLVVFQEETFKVFGICGMCKETIENTLKAMEGVSLAIWNEKSLKLNVRFDSLKLSLDDLKVALAAVGYDTDSHKATDAAYEGLHSCCKYVREK